MDDRIIYRRFPLIFIILVGLVNVFFVFLLGRTDMAMRTLAITIPVLASSIVLNRLYADEKLESRIKDILADSKNIYSVDHRILVLTFFYLFLLSIFILFYFEKRPIFYFIVVAFLYMILILEILNKKPRTNLIIFQNIILFLNIVWGVTMRYPLYFGGTDIISHLKSAELVAITGGISHLSSSYINFPLYHILVAQSSLISGLDILFSKNLFIGIVFSLSILLVYKLTKIVTKNDTISLLSMVFYSSFSVVLSDGMYMITRNIAFIGFLLLFLIIVKFNDKQKVSVRYTMIYSLFSIFILLVHQVSIFQFLLLFALLIVIQRVHKVHYLRVKEYLFLIVITISYWLLLAYSFSSHVILNILIAPVERDTEIVRTGITDTFSVSAYLFSSIDTMLFIFIFLTGTLCVLYYSEKAKLKVFILFSLILAIFFIPSPLDVMEVTRDIFTFQRMRSFVAPFMGIGLGIGFYLIIKDFSLSERYKNIKPLRTTYHAFVLFLIFGFIFVSITSPGISTDTDIHEHNPSRYFDEGELATFDFVAEHIPSTSFIQSDRFVVRYYKLGSINTSEVEEVEWPHHKQRPINNISSLKTLADNNYVIYRQGEFYDKNVLRMGYGPTRFTYLRTEENQLELEKNLEGNKKIYTNGNNHIYN